MVGVNHYDIDIDNEFALEAFRNNTGVTFPIGNGIAQSYLPLRQSASGSSPNGVHVIVDRSGTIRHLTRNYDETALISELDALVGTP